MPRWNDQGDEHPCQGIRRRPVNNFPGSAARRQRDRIADAPRVGPGVIDGRWTFDSFIMGNPGALGMTQILAARETVVTDGPTAQTIGNRVVQISKDARLGAEKGVPLAEYERLLAKSAALLAKSAAYSRLITQPAGVQVMDDGTYEFYEVLVATPKFEAEGETGLVAGEIIRVVDECLSSRKSPARNLLRVKKVRFRRGPLSTESSTFWLFARTSLFAREFNVMVWIYKDDVRLIVSSPT